MGSDKNEILEIARIIATCRKDRIPYVLEWLRQNGYDMPEINVEAQKKTGASKSWEERRQEIEHKHWYGTNDECILKLREIYEKGANMTQIARIVGFDRGCLYKYLWGTRNPSKARKERIMMAIAEYELAQEESVDSISD